MNLQILASQLMEQDVDTSKPAPNQRLRTKPNSPLLPEIDGYLHLLVLLYLLDSNRNADAVKCAGK